MNDIMASIMSALHPFLTLPNDVLKRKRGTFFFCFKRSHERHKKVPFLQLEVKRIKSEMLLKLSNLNSNLALTLGYRNPALKNSALVTQWPKHFQLQTCIFVLSGT